MVGHICLIKIDPEMKSIIQNFNLNLGKVKVDLEHALKMSSLNKELAKLESKKTHESLDKVKEGILSLEETVAEYSTQLELANRELNLFKSGVNSTLTPQNLFEGEMLDLSISLKLFEQKLRINKDSETNQAFSVLKQELSDAFDNLINNVNTEIEKNVSLREKNSNLIKTYETLDEMNYKKKYCIRCHLEFVPKLNDEKSCLYHPGRLQYYSCRGCGDDEYYTCCSKCMKCSKGCKYAKHVSET